jgi:outer membrane protein assembly factor BamB
MQMRTRKSEMKTKNKLLLAIFWFCILSSCSNQEYLPKTSHSATQIEKGKVKLIWSKDNIYTVWSTFSSTIGASNNMVCFLGGLDSSIDNDVVCMNGMSGKIIWQKSSGIHRSIAVTPNAVFVIYSSAAGVRKYNLSGEIVWSKYLGGTGSNYLYVVGGQLQILTVPERFWVLDFDGNEMQKINGDKIFISTSEGTFVESSGIQLLKTNSKEIIWQYHNLDDVLEMAPLFIDTKVLVRTGQESGSIYALDRKNGNFLWKTDNSIVSNVVYSPLKGIIYALNHNGELLAINENNGRADIIAEFASTPFVLNGEANVGSYQLAYDLNEKILFVSLGDSRQFFAFKEQ